MSTVATGVIDTEKVTMKETMNVGTFQEARTRTGHIFPGTKDK